MTQAHYVLPDHEVIITRTDPQPYYLCQPRVPNEQRTVVEAMALKLRVTKFGCISPIL